MRKEQLTSRSVEEADHLFDIVREQLRTLHGEIDDDRLRHAYELALSAHENQARLDGTPYILHPLEVAETCVELNMDEDAVIAALLHDTVEDTGIRLNQIRQLFGGDVAKMVDSLTKIKKIDLFARFTGRDKASNQARNLQRLFVAMSRDTRVIVIKLADRLHNMRTLRPMPEHKQRRIGRETLEFYIPIARRLGLGEMVRDLEDLVFEHLYPAEYAALKQRVAELFVKAEAQTSGLTKDLKKHLEAEHVPLERIYWRRKHLWSIFQKMRVKGVELEGIYDLLAVRVIVQGTALECYRALGVLHMHYKPIFERFRDFIASPKSNGYQSLHSTVFGPAGNAVECQIRTVEMELNAGKGVAAHWRYKEGAARHDHLIKDEAWVEFIGELSREERVSYEEFIARTRDTLLTDQVLVLSPRGEVVDLPRGSTPIDFAYYIHTELGHAIRSAKVNGAVVPLDYKLRNGDMVEVLKAEEPNPRPRPEWLVLAKSPKSLLKIRRYFKSLPRAERVEIGRGLLRQHIVKEGLFPLNLTANDKLLRLLRRLPVRSIDELYDKVALGQFQCGEIVQQLKRIHRSRAEAEEHAALAGKARGVLPTYALVGFATELGIQLAGGQPLRRKVELMACCTPVPGDHIYGIYDREERRVKAHRVECSVLNQALSQGDLIELGWVGERGEKRYPARIKIVSLNRVGMLFEILRILSARNINLGGAEFLRPPTVVESDRNSRFELIIEVSDKAELAACLKALTELDDILEASRATRALAAAPADGEA